LTETVRAAGGLVARRHASGATEVLIVHRPRYDDWTFPKGKNEPGESDEDCALREVEEEAGIRCSLGPEVGVTRYTDGRGRDKTARYFLMRPLAGAFRPEAEVDAIEWLAPDEAAERLSYRRDVPLLEGLAPPPPPQYLTRHASAGERSEWAGDDRLRPLDELGRRQAAGLVEQLGQAQIERILSSPYVRCTETVEPLAEARQLEVEERDELAEGAGVEGVRELLRSLAGTAAVHSVHGDVLEAFFGNEGEKGATRVVDADDRDIRVVAELPAPA